MKGLKVAITGNIGSGKTTVLEYLKEKGETIYSADSLTIDVYEICKDKLKSAFGNDVFDKNGKVDKNILGKKVFSDSEKLKKLNEIMHPVLKELISSLKKQEGRVFIEIPLLFETNLNEEFDNIWLVMATRDNKLKRVVLRDGITYDEINVRLNFQMPDDIKMQFSHTIIYNDGSKEELYKKVDDELQKIKDENN